MAGPPFRFVRQLNLRNSTILKWCATFHPCIGGGRGVRSLGHFNKVHEPLTESTRNGASRFDYTKKNHDGVVKYEGQCTGNTLWDSNRSSGSEVASQILMEQARPKGQSIHHRRRQQQVRQTELSESLRHYSCSALAAMNISTVLTYS